MRPLSPSASPAAPARWRWRRSPATLPSASPSSTGTARSSPMSSTERPAHLLILGGTGEAAALAAAAMARYGDELLVTSSLAGRTATRAPLPGRVRVGGFGGAAGLADYLATA